jgi:hypothetical protein
MFAVLFLLSLLVVQNSAQVVGYWYWAWQVDTRTPPVGATHGIAFPGNWLSEGIEISTGCVTQLPGTKLIAIGGVKKQWTVERIESTISLIKDGVVGKAGYTGITWWIEAGDSNLIDAFERAFKAAKDKGLTNWVTVPLTCPKNIKNSAELMKAILACSSVDYISPQLLPKDKSSGPRLEEHGGISWEDYKATKATIVPTLLSGEMYEGVFCFFQSKGIAIGGYVQWQQAGYLGEGPSVPTCKQVQPPPSPKYCFACGTDYADATCDRSCGKTAKNAECGNPGKLFCFYKASDKKSHSANDAVITTEHQNSDGITTTTTTTITSSESIPGYAVALLAIASVVVVVLIVLIALVGSKKKVERF